MRIFNIMMSRDLGGIQQAYLDYNEALLMQNHRVINISSVFAKINNQLNSNHKLFNLSNWCFISKIYLWFLVILYKPDAIICHGNRAISFAVAFKVKKIPIIGVSHNYSYKYLRKCDYVITLTNKLKQHLIDHDFNEEHLFSLPNMVRILHHYQLPEYKSPIVIGSFGRFVVKKGFIYLIEAIAILKQNNHNVKLLLGGDGVEKENLQKKVKELKLENDVIFYGWVNDKKDFFGQIDLFCLPSVIEPFGIILLEAIEHSKPIVSTKSGGPEEIIRNNIDGLLTETESSSDLAEKLQLAITDLQMTQKFTKSAYYNLLENYDIKKLSNKLGKILLAITNVI